VQARVGDVHLHVRLRHQLALHTQGACTEGETRVVAHNEGWEASTGDRKPLTRTPMKRRVYDTYQLIIALPICTR
jgi:hypothetical protein